MITTEVKSLKDMYLDVTDAELLPAEILGDYRENGASGVVDMGTFSAEESKKITEVGIKMINSIGDGWNDPSLLQTPQGNVVNDASKSQTPYRNACSCCIKKLDDGTVIMGRNMDLPISFAPAIIFRTKGDGKNTYDTVNIGYFAPGRISFDQVAEIGGMPKDIFALMSVSITDLVNSEGLYLQCNMRECADCPTTSSNPQNDFRVSTFNIIRIIGDNCSTIDEALEYIKDFDIYDSKCAIFDWSMSIGMMDKTGRYGVLEFANNKIIWNEGRPGFACGQCNFYWNKEAGTRRFGQGTGRWQKLMEHYYDINTQEDLEKVMQSIWYTQFLTDGHLARDWKVNWISELNDKIPDFVSDKWLAAIYSWRDEYGIKIDEKHLEKVLEIEKRHKTKEPFVWDADYLNDPENYYDVITSVDLYIKCFAQLPLEVQKMSGGMECSIISYVANNKELGFTNRFFEMNDVYHIGIHETKIERIPTTKKFGNI